MHSQLPEFYPIGPYPEINLGFVTLPTYYTVLSLTYCVAIFWFYKRCETRNLSQRNAMNIGLIVLFAGFIGARVFHILFEYPSYYLEDPIQVFYFWQGGYVFYGGFILAYVAAFIYAKKLRLTFWLWHDTLAPVLAGGYAMGRMACFLVGCCYGAACDLPWAVDLKQADVHSGVVSTVSRHPTQLYAVIFELVIMAFLIWYEKRKPPLGNVFLSWVGLHAIGRIIMETFRVDPRGGVYVGLSISTWISILFIAIVIATFIKKNPKKP